MRGSEEDMRRGKIERCKADGYGWVGEWSLRCGEVGEVSGERRVRLGSAECESGCEGKEGGGRLVRVCERSGREKVTETAKGEW